MNTAQRTELLNDKLATAETLTQIARQPIYADQREQALNTLNTIQRLIETAESAQRTAVAAARETGATWQDIANELRVTRQAAQQRYGG